MKALKRALLAKIESVYGTDPTLAAATDAVLCAALDPRPLDQEFVDRPLVRPYFGGFEQLPTRSYAGLQCDVEMAGFGTAGPATPTPGLAALLRSAALSQTVSAGVDVQYRPISSGEESAALEFYQDGMRHKLLGGRSNLEILMELNEIPLFRFSVLSKYAVPTDTAMVAPTITAYQKPVAVNEVNTSAFTLHGYAAKLKRLSLNLGNQLEKRNLVGQAAPTVEFTGREVTGTLEIEAPLIAQKDFWSAITGGTLAAFSVTHGPATKQVKLDGSNVQLIDPQYSIDQNIVHMSMGLRFVPGASGNDELTITVK
jgi:hypothetical protein